MLCLNLSKCPQDCHQALPYQLREVPQSVCLKISQTFQLNHKLFVLFILFLRFSSVIFLSQVPRSVALEGEMSSGAHRITSWTCQETEKRKFCQINLINCSFSFESITKVNKIVVFFFPVYQLNDKHLKHLECWSNLTRNQIQSCVNIFFEQCKSLFSNDRVLWCQQCIQMWLNSFPFRFACSFQQRTFIEEND